MTAALAACISGTSRPVVSNLRLVDGGQRLARIVSGVIGIGLVQRAAVDRDAEFLSDAEDEFLAGPDEQQPHGCRDHRRQRETGGGRHHQLHRRVQPERVEKRAQPLAGDRFLRPGDNRQEGQDRAERDDFRHGAGQHQRQHRSELAAAARRHMRKQLAQRCDHNQFRH